MSQVIKNLVNDKYENYILPFFWQHGEDENVLRKYMQVIHEAGIGAVCVESRPHPDFCGDKWWTDMDIILEEAKNRDMKVWILDDSHFPTGFANGAMKNEPISKARRSICCKKYELKAGEELKLSSEEIKHPTQKKLTEMEMNIAMMTGKPAVELPQIDFLDDELVGIVAIEKSTGNATDLSSEIDQNGELCFSAKEDCVIYKMNSTRNRGPHPDYINMTDKESVRVLIDAVYEKHYDHYKDYFGNVIEGFFSDEPELGNGHLYDLHHEMGIGFDMDYTWSAELMSELKKAFGGEFASKLPLIWETEGDEYARAASKFTYMDCLTKLIEKNFSYQIGDWCRARDVKYIGHIIEDNGQHCRTGSTLGHYFRALKGQDWAGIDDIGGQVYPMGENDNYDRGVFQVRNGNFYHFMLGKLANSLASLDDKKQGNAMCEIFGAYGWNEGLRLEKYLADHFMVRGINHFVPHAFSAKPFPDPDCPPHFYAHGHNPEYKAFGKLMKYMNRCCELISGGSHVAPIALMYHGEAEWTGKCLADENVARTLAEAQLEFDIVPQDVFIPEEGYKTSISDKKLIVNNQKYEAVVIPYMQFVSENFAKGIKQLLDAGVQVCFVDDRPEAVLGDDSLLEVISQVEVVSLTELVKNLNTINDLQISPADTYIRYYHYVKDETDMYMLVNENDKPYIGEITISGRFTDVKDKELFLYDAWNNRVYNCENDGGRINITLNPGKSRFILIPKDEADAKLLRESVVSETIISDDIHADSLNDNWKRSVVKSIDYPAYKNETVVSLPDDYAKVEPEFSGWIKYENSFRGTKGQKVYLEVTDAFEVVDLYINDKEVGTQIFAPYVFDISDFVEDGENSIRIEIATTLEREMLKVPDMFGRPKPEPQYGSGIVGEVKIKLQ